MHYIQGNFSQTSSTQSVLVRVACRLSQRKTYKLTGNFIGNSRCGSSLEGAVGSLSESLAAKRKENQTLPVAFCSLVHLVAILNKADPYLGPP
jgi:hypothetical protein